MTIDIVFNGFVVCVSISFMVIGLYSLLHIINSANDYASTTAANLLMKVTTNYVFDQ
jgi:hypothetical protein